jgi:hypothetical protein
MCTPGVDMVKKAGREAIRDCWAVVAETGKGAVALSTL